MWKRTKRVCSIPKQRLWKPHRQPWCNIALDSVHILCARGKRCAIAHPRPMKHCVFLIFHTALARPRRGVLEGKCLSTAFAEVQSPAMLNRYPGTLCTCTEWHLFPVGRAALRSRQRVHSTKGLFRHLKWHKNYGCQSVLCRAPFHIHVCCHLGCKGLES